jgi:hypothetical protein
VKLHLVEGAPLFARIRSFDIECPSCSYVYQVGATRHSRASSTWDPATARFRCIECGWRATLGVLAWVPAPGRKASRPDTMPSTVEEALRRRWERKQVGGQSRRARIEEDAAARVELSIVTKEISSTSGPVNRHGIKD